MEQPEKKIGSILRKRGMTLATAESCTGGLVAHRITNIAGSSDYFLGGVVAYANQVKMNILKVPEDILTRHGAVSEETVRAMAEGVRSLFNSSLVVSVSGVAGPGGGSRDKPVGTTWLGLSAAEGTWTRLLCWDGDRVQNKEASAEAALQFVLDYLDGILAR